MSQLKDSLRLQIEASHAQKLAKALEALDVLSDYLDNPNLVNGVLPALSSASTSNQSANGPALEAPARRRRRRAGESFRERVLGVITSEWATVATMVERTGLTIMQVRGVLSAPNLAERIEKRNSASGMEYHLRQEAGA